MRTLTISLPRARAAAALSSLSIVLVAGLSGCGSSLSEDQQALADYMTGDELASEGLIFNSGCVEDLAAEVPGDDAAAMVGDELEGEDLSADAQAFVDGLFGCLDFDAVADNYAERLDIDPGCMKDALEAVDPEGPDGELFDVLGAAVFECDR